MLIYEMVFVLDKSTVIVILSLGSMSIVTVILVVTELKILDILGI